MLLSSDIVLSHSLRCLSISRFDHHPYLDLLATLYNRLHRSVYSIAEKFVEATDSGRLDDPQCVRVSSGYIIARCRELIEVYGIKAMYLVMDGKRCPLKADESKDREDRRRQNLLEARKFKRLGQRDKSQDKYKSCIRIKDEFTRAVMEVVAGQFRRHDCVFIVWSPYEADAQLTKLCIDHVADAVVTEDSDILVYSAAAHIEFPILFKLDRRSGTCDMISMGWLLSMPPLEAEKAVTTNNTLETILLRFAARECKRPGFGVRLFVQSCVLAGSDYSINMIDGIGLIGAFKLVRDHAHRNDNVRFRKILEALPSKMKQKFSIDDYEERLAKSEAVFYYHYVKHTDGKVKPLVNPRLSHEENSDNHHFTDHSPFLSRWGEKWSFLGSPSSSSQVPSTNIALSSSSAIPSTSLSNNITVKKTITGSIRQSHGFQFVASTLIPKMVQHNPYNTQKTTHNCQRVPLKETTNECLIENKGSSFTSDVVRANVKQDHPVKGKSNDLMKYLKKGTDPRYVKRQFPPVASAKCAPKYSRLRGLPSFFQLRNVLGATETTHENAPLKNVSTDDNPVSNDSFVPFEYDGGDDSDGGFDCTISSYTHPIDIENGDFPQCEEGNVTTKELHSKSYSIESDSFSPSTAQHTSTHFNKTTSEELNQPSTEGEGMFVREEPRTTDTTSALDASTLEESIPHDLKTRKEFVKKRIDPRRVTLETVGSPNSIVSACESMDSSSQQPETTTMEFLITPSKVWALDECIDSPGTESVPDGHKYDKPQPPFGAISSVERGNAKKISTRTRPSSLCSKRKAGPLDRAFERQKRFSSRLQSPMMTTAPSSRSISGGKRRDGADLTSFFERIPRMQTTPSSQAKKASIGTTHSIIVDEIVTKMSLPKPSTKINYSIPQLEIQTNQTLDDFLWDGP
jgi:5'-3' exonuclease